MINLLIGIILGIFLKITKDTLSDMFPKKYNFPLWIKIISAYYPCFLIYKQGYKILAVKKFRNMTGLDLLTSKNFVDKWFRQKGE